MQTNKSDQFVVVLDNIRSVHNVGSMFRTSDAIGIDHLYICGISPAPIDRFGRERTDLDKVALGAQKTVPWTQHSSTLECVTFLKSEGYSVVCIEQTKSSIDYKNVSLSQKTAFVFGNEVNGITQDVIDQADECVEITMHGNKESLNVSVTFGIVLFRILNR